MTLGENVGYLWFAPNFTDTIFPQSSFLFNWGVVSECHDNGFVQVHLDRTDMQKTSLVERKLSEAYEIFIGNVMFACGKSEKSGKLVVASEALIGSINFEFTQSMAPGFIIG